MVTYVSHLLQQVGNSSFYIYEFLMILSVSRCYFVNSLNLLIFVSVESSVFFTVRTEFLSIRRASA
jgi:hypothetical protein